MREGTRLYTLEEFERAGHFVDDVEHGRAGAFRLTFGDGVGHGVVCIERGRFRLHRVFAQFHPSTQHGGDGAGINIYFLIKF